METMTMLAVGLAILIVLVALFYANKRESIDGIYGDGPNSIRLKEMGDMTELTLIKKDMTKRVPTTALLSPQGAMAWNVYVRLYNRSIQLRRGDQWQTVN